MTNLQAELLHRMHILLAEALRCLDDGNTGAVRRKLIYADALLQSASPVPRTEAE